MVIVRYWRDGGHGATEHSVDYFFKACRHVLHEWGAARPLRVEIKSNGLAPAKNRAPYTMKVEFGLPDHEERYAILLSGTQAGYGGTGPHGTASILRFLGVPEHTMKLVFSEEQLLLEWSESRGWRPTVLLGEK